MKETKKGLFSKKHYGKRASFACDKVNTMSEESYPEGVISHTHWVHLAPSKTCPLSPIFLAK